MTKQKVLYELITKKIILAGFYLYLFYLTENSV